MNKTKEKLAALGAVGAIIIVVAAGVVAPGEGEVVGTPESGFVEVQGQEKAGIVIDQKGYVVDSADFINVKKGLKDKHDANGYVDIMDFYGAEVSVFTEVIDAEIKGRGGVQWDNVNSNNIRLHIVDLLAP